MSAIYQGVPFEWDQPNDQHYRGKTIRIIERNPQGAIINMRRATDEEVRTVMILQATAWASSKLCTPAYQYEPHPFDYGKAARVSAEQVGLET